MEDDLQRLQTLAEEVTERNKLLVQGFAVLRQNVSREQLAETNSPDSKLVSELLRDNHAKQARIEVLERQLSVLQMKCQRWKLKYPLSSPPGSDNTTPEASVANGLSPSSSASTKASKPIPESLSQPLQAVSDRQHISKKRRGDDEHGCDAIPTIAEDSENNQGKPRALQNEAPSAEKPAPFNRRLSDLFERPNYNKAVRLGDVQRHMPIASNSSARFRKPSSFVLSNPHAKPRPEDEEPIRARPVHQLSSGHFKTNHESNGSFSHAFGEVVRDREQRKCLPRCARPECCGNKFTVIASTLPDTFGANVNHAPDIWISDNKLLQDFLGSGSEDKIRNLTPVARANLLAEAKTNLIASTFGKHRNARERAISPPGFWNADMPGTQEALRDREEARAAERQEVERKYREACRGDGKWVFADE